MLLGFRLTLGLLRCIELPMVTLELLEFFGEEEFD